MSRSNASDRDASHVKQQAMLLKRSELPPQAGKAFVRDVKAVFTAKIQPKQGEIAADAGWKLHSTCRGTTSSDRRESEFLQMRDLS